MASFSYDITSLKQNIAKILAEVDEAARGYIREAATTFASIAAQWTPPFGKSGKGPSRTIAKQKYTRPIYSLLMLAKEKHASSADYEALRAGFFFKIIKKKFGGKKQVVYAKTEGQAKQIAVIKHRGLAKVMWGKNLENIGAAVPTVIQSLLSKSPLIEGLNFNKVGMHEEDGSYTVTIENQAENIQAYAGYAEKVASGRTEKWLIRKLRAEQKKARQA